MIYICTNKEILGHQVSPSAEQSKRLDALNYNEDEFCSNVAEMVDPSYIVSALIIGAGFDYSPQGTFRDWQGGSIVQFHKSWGALFAYDEETEFPIVQEAAKMLEAALAEAIELELSELEEIV
jgi:hypothetical protein